ncbi:MAG: glutathione S-transferase family protein [Kofleriaceae bacterium]
MKLELVSHPLCPFVHRAAIMLHEKQIAFELRYVDLRHKPSWFLELSPLGQVPVLIADGEALFESSAIVEFLDEIHPPPLVPRDPFERARQRAWVEVANDLVHAQFKALTAGSDSAFAVARRDVAMLVERFERALAAGHIDADGFGLVHVALAPVCFRFVVAEQRLGASLIERAPRFTEYTYRLASRPSVVETVPDDFADRLVVRLFERGSRLARVA